MIMNAAQMMARRWREATLILVCFVMLAGLWARGPIPQDILYHDFADQRELLGVPNLLDVASNIAFLVVGVAGILLCAGARRPPLAGAWSALFVGTALVFLGSSYYHWQPSNESLIWDRLPMTVGFMALFVALLAEHMGERLERLLAPAIVLGIASALWWHFTDDLRFYLWVQFTPLVCIPLVLAMYRGTYTHRAYLLYALGLYVCAKIAEVWDRQIFALTSNAISGHTLKHLLAAGAILAILLMLAKRAHVRAR